MKLVRGVGNGMAMKGITQHYKWKMMDVLIPKISAVDKNGLINGNGLTNGRRVTNGKNKVVGVKRRQMQMKFNMMIAPQL